jgi:hypothetical protein
MEMARLGDARGSTAAEVESLKRTAETRKPPPPLTAMQNLRIGTLRELTHTDDPKIRSCSISRCCLLLNDLSLKQRNREAVLGSTCWQWKSGKRWAVHGAACGGTAAAGPSSHTAIAGQRLRSVQEAAVVVNLVRVPLAPHWLCIHSEWRL